MLYTIILIIFIYVNTTIQVLDKVYKVIFDITQAIGLTNNDKFSKEYRPLKQIIERLNRTFKGDCGYL